MTFSVNPGFQVPEEYLGREQTFIKHRVLKLYIQSWAQKIASIAGQFGAIRIWYVDCFSGPWKSASQALEDTSIHIGLNAIQEAAAFWKERGFNIQLGAIFVEKDKAAYARLQEYLASRKDSYPVTVHALSGEFGEHVQRIEALIQDDPAFLFVDPTGWKGAAMRFIAPLAKKPRRDVMINVMFDYLNRFKELGMDYVRQQMIDFFDADVPAGLSEEELMRFYRSQLKKACGTRFSADLIVQDPCKDRTKFRLVLGAHHEAAVKLFRDVEKKVLGGEAPAIRSAAKENERVNRTGQFSLLQVEPTTLDLYSQVQAHGVMRVEEVLASQLEKRGPQPFKSLRADFLEECHLTDTDLRALLWKWKTQGRLSIERLGQRDRSLKDDHLLTALRPSQPEFSSVAIQESLFDLAASRV